MKKLFLISIFIIAALQFAFAQAPVLGIYPPTTISAAGGNTHVTPSTVPTGATRIAAYTTTSFKGLLNINPATGELLITNAQPAGNYIITIKAFAGAATTTTTFLLTVNANSCTQGLFTGSVALPVGNLVSSIEIGDFNRDGKQDFVTANSGTDIISIRFGNGLGGFAGNTELPTGDNPSGLAISDFNGDGFQDIATANRFDKTIAIRLGNGSGSFGSITTISTPGFPQSMAVADFNNDGRPDIAIANNNNNAVAVHLGDGTGGFSSVTESVLPAIPGQVVIGDFNEDGNPDFAVTLYYSNKVIVRLGNGAGGFTAGTDINAGAPFSIATADFNGDGHIDFAIPIFDFNTVNIQLGNGMGGFSTATGVTVPGKPSVVTTGDFNGDGKQDIIASINSGNYLAVRLGNGAGGFTGTGTITVGNSPNAVATGDFNADGRLDLAALTNANLVAIRLGNANDIKVLGNGAIITAGDNTPDVADSTDFGNGGLVARRFIIRNTSAVNLSVVNIRLSGTDSFMFSRSNLTFPFVVAPGIDTNFTVTFTPTTAGLKTAVVHIENDNCDKGMYSFAIQGMGVPPAIAAYSDTIIIATGADTSVLPVASPTSTSIITAFSTTGFKGSLHVHPITGKLIITNARPAGTHLVTVKAFNGLLTTTVSVYIKVTNPPCSQGIFTGNTNLAVGDAPSSVAVGDFDNDGKQDLAISNFGSDNLHIRLGDGAGGFSMAANVVVRDGPGLVRVNDVNGDGNQDLLVIHGYTNSVSVRLGNGAGGFAEIPDITGIAASGLVVGDFNSDGKADFAASGSVSNNVFIRLGDGTGGFSGNITVPVGNRPSKIEAADFNNDGRLDFATTNSEAGTVSIRIQNIAGGFSAFPDVPVGSNPGSMDISDLNGDGKLDLAVANYTSSNVSIRLGTGSGTFTGTGIAQGGTNPAFVVAEDFNGDGKPDLAIASGTGNNFTIRIGDGAGNFSGQDFVMLGNNQAGFLAAGDFNSDGKLDIATTSNGTDLVAIRFGNGNEINVLGNSTVIADGNNAPAVTNHTDFGTLTPGGGITRTFTIQNTGAGLLLINDIRINTADSAAFIRGGITLPFYLSAGSSTTFTIRFSPISEGIKNTRVTIVNNDCDESDFDFAIKGDASCGTIGPDNIWLGTSANWNLPSNWSLGFVPVACTKVVVNAGVPFMPDVTSPTSACYSLMLNNGATVTVRTGGHLNIIANK